MEIMAICDDMEHRVRTFDVQADLVNRHKVELGRFPKTSLESCMTNNIMYDHV